MLDSVVDGVAVVNMKQRYVYLNPAAIRLLGPLHLDGTPPGAFFEPDEVTPVDPSLMPLVRGLAGHVTPPFRVFAKNPSVPAGRHLRLSGGPWLNGAGEVVGAVEVLTDVAEPKPVETEVQSVHELLERKVAERSAQLQAANDELKKEVAGRLRAEEALRTSEEKLHQAQKLEVVGRLAGGIAHDFNNMLSAMLGYAGLIALSLPPDAESQQDVKQIVLAGERATALIRQLLAFTRKQVVQPSVLDVSQVVAGLSEMLRRLLGEKVELQVEASPGTCCVLADVTQLEQVLLNLSINARDAMPNGGHLKIAITSAQLPDQSFPPVSLKPGSYVRLTVTDDGVGMSEETRKHVFEPFFTTKPRGQGTGLGAATVFSIVTQSGGDVLVKSAPGKGSSFDIYLPKIEGQMAEAPPLSEVLRSRTRSSTVLLVEDEPLVRAATARILSSAGIKVLEASNPDAALSLCMQHPESIDLLLTDVVLPSMNGRELAAHVIRLRPRVRVLYMSGYTDDAVSNAELLDPGAAFLPKPFSPDTLVQRIDEVLGSSLK